MKDTNQIVQYLSGNSFAIDELGRVVIDDPAILSEINGAFGGGDALSSELVNGACANVSC